MSYCSRDGHPLTLEQWTQLRPAERVALTELPGCVVSTLWVGVDVGDGLIFETVLLRGGEVDMFERYATELDAIKGHLRWVERYS